MVGEIKRVRCIGSSLTEEDGARALHIYKMSEDRHGGNVGNVGDGVILVGWLVVGGCSRCWLRAAERRAVYRWAM